jgi:hypothetical protein
MSEGKNVFLHDAVIIIIEEEKEKSFPPPLEVGKRHIFIVTL